MSPLTVLWRACAAQALVIGALFVLLALLLPRAFFREYGAVAGPLSWLACALVVGSLLRLRLWVALAAAVLSGAAGAAASLAAGHTGGMVVGVLAFGAACAAATAVRRGHPHADERPARRLLRVGAAPSPDPSRRRPAGRARGRSRGPGGPAWPCCWPRG